MTVWVMTESLAEIFPYCILFEQLFLTCGLVYCLHLIVSSYPLIKKKNRRNTKHFLLTFKEQRQIHSYKFF